MRRVITKSNNQWKKKKSARTFGRKRNFADIKTIRFSLKFLKRLFFPLFTIGDVLKAII